MARSGAGTASNAVTIDNTTFGTGVKALNLTNAGNLTTAAGVDITLNSATSVSVNNAAATKYTTVAVTDTSTTAASTGSTLTTVSITGSTDNATLTGNAITTVNLNGAATAAGKTVTVTAAAAARALTVNVSGTTASGNVTDAQATTATLNQTAAATMGTLTVAKATTVSINTTGVATTAGAETLSAAKMTTLNIGGTRANTVTASDYSALTSIVVAGSGGVTLGNLSAISTLTSVDTSAATNVASAAGAANLTVANSVQLGTLTAFTGGAGSDTVTVGATTKAINLGTGANKVTLIDGTTAIGTGGSITGDGTDTLAFETAANAASVSGGSAASVAAFKAAVTGFSTLELGAVGTATAINVNNFAAAGVITQVNLTGNAAANTTTISNLASNATIKVTGANTSATTATAGTTGSSTSDVLNLSLSQATGTAVAFGTFETPNVENINFIMADTQATPTGTYNTATLTDSAVNTINVSGNNGLDLTLTSGANNLQTFNASGVTLGGVKVTSGALQYASTVTGSTVGGDTLNFAAALAAVNVTTTAGTNTVRGSSTVASVFTGGTGADTFFGGTGADTVNAGSGADVVYGNNSGTKQVQVVEFGTTALAANSTATFTIAGTAVVITGAAGGTAADDVGAAAVTAINTNAALKYITVAAYDATTNILSLTDIVDGVQTVTAAVAVGTPGLTLAAGNIGTTAGTRVGTSTTTGADVITGGASSDTFIFGISSAAPSATALQTVSDFSVGSVSDYVFYAPTLAALAGTVTTATNGVAAISANGIATFTTSDQVSLAAELTAVAAAIQAGTTAQGESVAFQYGSDAYMFISDASNGVTAGDVLVKLTGINLTNTSTDQLVASGHTLTLA